MKREQIAISINCNSILRCVFFYKINVSVRSLFPLCFIILYMAKIMKTKREYKFYNHINCRTQEYLVSGRERVQIKGAFEQENMINVWWKNVGLKMHIDFYFYILCVTSNCILIQLINFIHYFVISTFSNHNNIKVKFYKFANEIYAGFFSQFPLITMNFWEWKIS